MHQINIGLSDTLFPFFLAMFKEVLPSFSGGIWLERHRSFIIGVLAKNVIFLLMLPLFNSRVFQPNRLRKWEKILNAFMAKLPLSPSQFKKATHKAPKGV